MTSLGMFSLWVIIRVPPSCRWLNKDRGNERAPDQTHAFLGFIFASPSCRLSLRLAAISAYGTLEQSTSAGQWMDDYLPVNYG
ncbi:MAG: hypothetical protein WB714_21075 [Candidatus Sulfotelmatobacter sp.]